MTGSFKLPASTALAAFCVSTLASCDRSGDPGLTERISLLQAEVSQRDASMKTLREDFQKEKESASSESAAAADAPVIDPSKARQSYLATVDNLRASLSKSLGSDATVDRASVFPVTGPDPEYPISSKVAFDIISKGRKAEVVIPLVANAAGEWKEPSGDEIAGQFRKSLASAPAAPVADNTQPSAPPQQRPQQQKPATPTDVMGAGRTVQVGWDEPAAPPANNGRPANPTPAPTPTPQAPPSQPNKPANQTPNKVMPSSRDVIIDFDH